MSIPHFNILLNYLTSLLLPNTKDEFDAFDTTTTSIEEDSLVHQEESSLLVLDDLHDETTTTPVTIITSTLPIAHKEEIGEDTTVVPHGATVQEVDDTTISTLASHVTTTMHDETQTFDSADIMTTLDEDTATTSEAPDDSLVDSSTQQACLTSESMCLFCVACMLGSRRYLKKYFKETCTLQESFRFYIFGSSN